MKFQVQAGRIEDSSRDAILLLLFKDEALPAMARHVDEKLRGQINSVIKSKEFSGKAGQTYLLNVNIEKVNVKRVVLSGIGGRSEFSLDKIRGAASRGAVLIRNLGLKNFAVLQPLDAPCSPEDSAQSVAEGIALGLYQHMKYRTEDVNEIKKIEEVAVYTEVNKLKLIEKAVEQAQKVCEAANYAREIDNEPGNVGTPTKMAKYAEETAKKYGFKCKVLGLREIEALKMQSFLSVARGSIQEPKFAVMEYGQSSRDTIVLVGKGITFDSGGISIKPSKDMEKMKWDKSGACAVIGAMAAVSALKLPLHVIGLTPFTENLPSGSASRPGDVVYASNGKSIEVANTDAEGRLVLADALVYAAKYKAKAVIDMATLTGACVVALGDVAAGLMGNDEKLMEKIRKAGEKSGEKVWQLPLWKEYDEKIKSDIADVKNTGSGQGDAGAITAAAFLKKFVNYPWAHIDIAGTAWNDYDKPYGTKGSTGFGVRLIVEMLKEWKS
ncbi:MAG: leucyl aminopeptidase [Candidatus Micrarchaeota archaeon]